MTSATDAERIAALLAFGWAVAEMRGRYRQALLHLPHPQEPRPARSDHTLPLNVERSPGELIHQVMRQLHELAGTLGTLAPPLAVNVAVAELPYQATDATGTALEALDALWDQAHKATDHDDTTAIGDSTAPTSVASAWNALAALFYAWDTAIQDILTSVSSTDAAAYQLGRGLAESYWALDPQAPDTEAHSWASLFGRQRRETLTRFLVQLTPYIDPLTVRATSASFETWCDAVTAGVVRNHAETVRNLGRQVTIWRALLIDRISPSSLEDPRAALPYAGRVGIVLRTFGWELALGTLAAVVALGAIVFLVVSKSTPAATVLTAILGFFGITGAGLLAVAKAAANASLAKMRAALDVDIVAGAVTISPVPPAPKAGIVSWVQRR